MNIICDSVLKVKMCVQYIILNYYDDDRLEFGQTLQKWFILMLLIDVTFKKSCFIILRMSFAYPADDL